MARGKCRTTPSKFLFLRVRLRVDYILFAAAHSSCYFSQGLWLCNNLYSGIFYRPCPLAQKGGLPSLWLGTALYNALQYGTKHTGGSFSQLSFSICKALFMDRPRASCKTRRAAASTTFSTTDLARGRDCIERSARCR
jgi:hypothetical protein